MLFVRCLRPDAEDVDVQSDYVRVWAHDVEGVIRLSFEGAADKAFLDDLVNGHASRAGAHAEQARRAPVLERVALEDAVRAMTFGKVDVAPIVDAVVGAASDPVGHVRTHKALCLEWMIDEPVVDLPVIALLQHLPPRHLLYFDWKEAMADVLPMLADLLQDGPGITFDTSPFLPKCTAWDKKARGAAMKELAMVIDGALLIEIKTDSDAYSIVCIPREDAKMLRAWKKNAHLPLSALARVISK